ncbi:T9SS type A sorting domain-containing protein [Antarcticibacterium arcticum]|uniref:T9SS type A sorting domain-containing protein n=1 Tax=Antarcticibacterium arcticum TaxID=2585771 RepID=A0A5B8YPW8_9FLAO|nr:T9SS type A sorting domain-containing protein [Antarcticibacterium arcticum]QED38947.1 T9SS type A sorting domain-containing protein [Antarcticibacterium arcticum]
MKTRLPFLFSLFIFSFSFAQEKLVFSYDAAGNQILRDRLCVGCVKTQESIVEKLEKEEDEGGSNLNDKNKFKFAAYPNPVTDILQAYWENTEHEYITHMSMFTIENKLLFSNQISPKQANQDINFAGYPPGLYILTYTYNTNRRESYKVLKN